MCKLPSIEKTNRKWKQKRSSQNNLQAAENLSVTGTEAISSEGPDGEGQGKHAHEWKEGF